GVLGLTLPCCCDLIPRGKQVCGMESKETDAQFALRLLHEKRAKDQIVIALIQRGSTSIAADKLVADLGKAANPMTDAQLLSRHNSAAGKRDKKLQRLILLNVRNGEPPSELSAYTPDQRSYNAALLIDDGFAKGVVRPDPIGRVSGAIITELTSKGHDFLDAT